MSTSGELAALLLGKLDEAQQPIAAALLGQAPGPQDFAGIKERQGQHKAYDHCRILLQECLQHLHG